MTYLHSLASALAYHLQPCQIPPNPGSLSLQKKKDFGSTSTASLQDSQLKTQNLSFLPAAAGKKIVSSISQPQSCASQLRRFPTNLQSRLATSTSAAWLRYFVSCHRFKLAARPRNKREHHPLPTSPLDSLFSLSSSPVFHPSFFFIYSSLAKLA